MELMAVMRTNTWTDSAPWVDLFRWLGNDAGFPPPEASEADVRMFSQHVIISPVVVSLVGLLISVVLFCYLCCCHWPPRGRVVKPSSKPLLFIALLIVAAIIFSSIVCWSIGKVSFNTAKEQLDRAVNDLGTAQTQGEKLNTTATDIFQQVNALYTKCPQQVRAQIKEQLDPTVKDLKQYINTTNEYTTSIKSVLKQLDNVQASSEPLGELIAAALTLPMMIVTISCLVIILAAMATRGCGGQGMARCNDCCLIRFGSIFIVLAVLVAAVAAAGECAFCIVTSSFCHVADTNVLQYAQHQFGSASDEYRAAKYYITGEGSNPYNQSLSDGKAEIIDANKTLTELVAEHGVIVKVACKGWTATAIKHDMHDMMTIIDSSEHLIDRANIYPYYDSMVHKSMCQSVIAGIGWLIACQLLVGVIFLPVLAVMSASFFAKWVAWNDATPSLLGPGSHVEAQRRI